MGGGDKNDNSGIKEWDPDGVVFEFVLTLPEADRLVAEADSGDLTIDEICQRAVRAWLSGIPQDAARFIAWYEANVEHNRVRRAIKMLGGGSGDIAATCAAVLSQVLLLVAGNESDADVINEPE